METRRRGKASELIKSLKWDSQPKFLAQHLIWVELYFSLFLHSYKICFSLIFLVEYSQEKLMMSGFSLWKADIKPAKFLKTLELLKVLEFEIILFVVILIRQFLWSKSILWFLFLLLGRTIVALVYVILCWRTFLCNPLARREAPAEGRTPEGEGANIDRRLVPYHGKCRRIQPRIEFIHLSRRAEGEGANIYRRLVRYHAKSMRIQPRIEFIYIFICINYGPFCDGVRRLGIG